MPRTLLTGLRRIILEQLCHRLLQCLVVLIRVFLEVDGFGGISAPDQLLSSWVIQTNYQRSDGNGGRLALNRGEASAPERNSAPPAITSRAPQVYALLLIDGSLITHKKVPTLLDPGETLLRQLCVDCPLNVLIEQLIT